MASQNLVPRYLSATLTQGGADAFVQATVLTDIVPENGYGLRVIGVEIEQRTADVVAAAANSIWEMSFARDTKAAIADLADPDVWMTWKLVNRVVASGASLQECSRLIVPAATSILVEPYVYIQLDSASTGVANVVNVRIHYEEVKLTEIEILRLLNNA